MLDSRVDAASWVQVFSLEQRVEAFEKMLAAKGEDIKAIVLQEA